MSAKPKLDPLLAALISRLPSGGPPWTRESRVTWLRMFSMGLSTVYGEVPEILIDQTPPFAEYAAPPTRALSAAPPPANAVDVLQQLNRCTIDREGYVRGPDGERVVPSQIGGEVLYDLRGEHGDLGAITWADGAMGVLGLQLEISAVNAKK